MRFLANARDDSYLWDLRGKEVAIRKKLVIFGIILTNRHFFPSCTTNSGHPEAHRGITKSVSHYINKYSFPSLI
jgi:hypothetical protein